MRKVCFLGTTSTGLSAPFDDDTWEIWGVSMRCPWVKRATRWYEIHRLDGTFYAPGEAENWRNVLKNEFKDVPSLHMIYPEPGLHPGLKQIDAPALERRFGGFWLSSTFAWMWSDLINEQCPGAGRDIRGGEPCHVMLAGVEMEGGTEYAEQRKGMQHFIDMVSSHGWQVDRLAGSSFAYEPVPYPFWQDDPLHCKLEREIRKMEKIRQSKQEMLDDTQAMLVQTRTLATFLEGEGKDWPGAAARVEALHQAEANLCSTSISLCSDLVHVKATKETHENWLRWLKPNE